MADQKDKGEFPDLSNKLAAPTKKSMFERQKAEAEAKRLREEAETAAVYQDFVKSFEDEGDFNKVGSSAVRPLAQAHSVPRMSSGPPKRHFAPASRNSGPGSLGPPPNLSRKRALDGSRPHERNRDRGIFAFEDSPDESSNVAAAFRTSDDEEDIAQGDKAAERAAAKPTLQLASLPPGTSPAVLKSILPPDLNIDGIQVKPPAGPGGTNSLERKAMFAIVTLASETPASELDNAVSTLQNRYMGWGYYLSISRHLSSATLNSIGAGTASAYSSMNARPFGAQPSPQGIGGTLNRVPPSGMHRGGFAPPSSYDPAVSVTRDAYQVKVTPPADIKQLKLINKTLEALITHGPEFEALIMSRPEVQREERWSWIWNARSAGGVWYRWRLWEIITGKISRTSTNPYGNPATKIFEGSAPWLEPEETPNYEFVTEIDELVSDSAYNSSEEDDSGDENRVRGRRRQFESSGGPPPDMDLSAVGEDQSYLNPFHKAKFTHLLTRLPTSTARLRKGDVARVTAFAISGAGKGAEEVVNMLVNNILRPLNWNHSLKIPHLNPDEDDEDYDADPTSEALEKQTTNNRNEDKSGSTMIALHLISDILSASSTSGVRHAWKYRSLFETVLEARKIFVFLGRLEKELGWGRLRAEKWKRSVNNILQLWEGWCVFPAATQEKFVEAFNNPPLTVEEAAIEEQKLKEKSSERGKFKTQSKWKAVDANETTESIHIGEKMDVDGAPITEDDIVGAPLVDEDIDGEPMEDEDLDGEPMEEDEEDDTVDKEPVDKDESNTLPTEKSETPATTPINPGPNDENKPRRARLRAVDMFADSDEEG